MEGAAQSLLSNAGQLLASEYRQLRGVGGDVSELRDDLAAMNALLLMQSEAKDGVVDPFIKEIMKQVRELAYDAEDRIDLYRLRIKGRPGDGVFARLKHLLQTLSSRRGLAGDIRALRARAISISERHARYGVNREALGWSPASSAAPMLTASARAQLLGRANDDAGHRQVVGMEDQVDDLVKRLKASAGADQRRRKVFSIVGFGGVGKTTLAMEVCRQLEADFPYQAFVSVSQAFEPTRDLKGLLKRMLEQIVMPKEKGIVEAASLDGTDSMEVHQLAKKLEEGLKDKRYTSCIYTTSFKSPGQTDKWHTICKSIGSQMESNPTLEGMRHIVTLSFNHLPHELKGCMMYFSIFPEDYAIKKGRLLNRWIAEGLVSKQRGLTMIEAAESYLDELLSRNMIEEDRSDLLETNVRSYRVHDMLLEVMMSRSLEANFVSLQGGPYDELSYDRIRRLSIHGSVKGPYSPSKRKSAGHRGMEEVNMQHVRSLSIFHSKGHKFLDQLGKFTLLRVLDLEDCAGVTNKHVRYACRLHLLKYLSFKSTNISVMPPQIDNLKHLQILDVENTLLDDLPKTVTKLERLECLWISKKDGRSNWALPRGISKVKALRGLTDVCLGDDAEVAQEVGELEQLQNLSLTIQTNRTDVLQQLALSLSKRYSLQYLVMERRKQDDGISEQKVLNFLHDLPAPPPLLRVFSIYGEIDGLPSWVGSLACLTDFTIVSRSLDVDQLFSVMHQLPNLKTLDVELDENSNDEVAARTSQKFAVLSHFKFSSPLPNAICFEEGSMEMLEQLVLGIRSYELETTTSLTGMKHLSNLKKVTIEGHKDSPAMNHVLGQLKAWNDGLPKPLQIAVKPW
ncbi:hypothetical protein EJB05_15256, partial [Eragrostis curvula]